MVKYSAPSIGFTTTSVRGSGVPETNSSGTALYPAPSGVVWTA